MAFLPSFSSAQASDLVDLVLTDTSTGVDAAITSRRVYLTRSDGSALVPTGTITSYIDWPLGLGNTLTTPVLNIDYALNVLVQWLDVVGNVLYSASMVIITPARENQYGYYLTQLMAAKPSIVNKANFFYNLAKFWSLVKNATNAVGSAADITAGQNMLNDAAKMMNQPNVFFI